MWLKHTHSLTHTQTLPWDWIDTPLCSAEGGIDIIPGLRPNTLLSFTEREREREGRQREGLRQGQEEEGRERKIGTTCSQVTKWPVASACVFVCATRMQPLQVKESELETRLAVKPHSAANKIIDLFFHCSLSPLLPGLSASCDPLGWSCHLSFSSSSTHPSCTSPFYGCRGS